MTTNSELADMNNSAIRRSPRRIFLDTNIVQNLHSFGEFIYDNYLAPEMHSKVERLGSRFTDDIYALRDFMALGQRNDLPIAVSARMLKELEATPQPYKRFKLSVWGNELAHYFTSHFDEVQDEVEGLGFSEARHFTHSQRADLSNMLKSLPDKSDRQLIVDALEYGCDIFLTMDYKTVGRYRDVVGQLGIQVMRPSELLKHISPSAGLLS